MTYLAARCRCFFAPALAIVGLFGGCEVANAQEECVVGVTISGTIRSAGLAVGYVEISQLHETIRECNSAVHYSANTLPLAMDIDLWRQFDSLTFQCIVPKGCSPSDENEISPASFVYVRDYWLKGWNMDEAVENQIKSER